MLILHAGVHDGFFTIWLEASADHRQDNGAAKQGKPQRGGPPDYPYGAPPALLREVLNSLPYCGELAKLKMQRAVLWAPSAPDAPLASSALIAEHPEYEALTIAPWSIASMQLGPKETVDFLAATFGQRLVRPGLMVGPDVTFWIHALRFAGGMVARQQFLPDLDAVEEGFAAQWTPVYPGLEGHRLAALAAAMPSSARAISFDENTAPTTPSRIVLDAFIAWMVDDLVRGSFAGQNPPRGKSPHDRWLHALATQDGLVQGYPDQLERIAKQVRQWRRPVALTADAPFRLCFRLEEPPEDGAAWSVRYLVQSVDNPENFLRAEQIGSGEKLPGVSRQPTLEFLLTSLTQATSIVPRIESSLRASIPTGFDLDTQGAYDFLTQRSVSLEQGGFAVQLPPWWSKDGTRAHLSARAVVHSDDEPPKGGLSLNFVLGFDWKIAIGDQLVTRDELLEIERLRSPLVKVHGQWAHVTPQEISISLDFWRRNVTGSATVREVIQMALGNYHTNAALAIEGVIATGWVKGLLDQLEGRTVLEDLPPPKDFKGTLRPYQVRGYSWLKFLRKWGLGSCLADDMGLGKTIQALALFQLDRDEGVNRPALLICPTSVVGNWQKEAQRFTPKLKVLLHHGINRAKGDEFTKAAYKNALVITSYGLLQRDLDSLKQVQWAGIILDEAQNIKNPDTRQARAARAIEGDYRIALTGTPVENNVGELWSVMEFLNPGFLGTRDQFRKNFFLPIQTGRDTAVAGSLRRLTAPFLLRRLKTDTSIIADLPEKMEAKVFCSLTAEQMALYEQVTKDAYKLIETAEGIGRRGVILATLSKLKQVCNHPAHFLGDGSSARGRSGKLARLTEMLEEVVVSGDRALVFSQFTEMGKILQHHLLETYGEEVLFLHGGTPQKQREAMVDRFQNSPNGPRIFILSLKAGGTGLNLTRASHVFHYDRWWNPAVEDQATDRAFRIGQKSNVQVHKFICVGTLEERVDEMIERKKGIVQEVIGTGEQWITELSNEELKSVFALTSEAMEES
ncbi:MAG: DEAD/DEAH box helicase [Acidobacteria bacterium]|nr:DEAD/DEAH box helicase [Acidobacteriota bacterium]